MIGLIDRLAARFGYYRETSLPVRELIIFDSFEEAREAGFFRPTRLHDDPMINAWWPALGVAGLCGRPIQRVTISRRMLRHRTSEGQLRDILRARQRTFGCDALWIEL